MCKALGLGTFDEFIYVIFIKTHRRKTCAVLHAEGYLNFVRGSLRYLKDFTA